MNDELEGLELKRVLEMILKSSDSSDEYDPLLNSVKQLSEAFLLDKYLFSATHLRDDISQWRAYTSVGQGICFGFHDDFILDKTINKLGCIYQMESKKQFIQERTRFFDYKNSEFQLEKRKNGSLSGLVDSVLMGMEYFKHESFSPEKEIRWIDDLNAKGDSEVLYRPHRLGLMPYRLVSIDASKISEVIIGPQVPKQNIATLYKLLKENRNIKVISSDVTLR